LDRTEQPLQTELFVLLTGVANRVSMTVQMYGDILYRLAAADRQDSSRAPDMLPRRDLSFRHPLQCGQIPGSDFHTRRFAATHDQPPGDS
jgi:hypothetical protein